MCRKFDRNKNSIGFAYSLPKIKKQLNEVQAIKRCSNNTKNQVWKKMKQRYQKWDFLGHQVKIRIPSSIKQDLKPYNLDFLHDNPKLNWYYIIAENFGQFASILFA